MRPWFGEALVLVVAGSGCSFSSNAAWSAAVFSCERAADCAPSQVCVGGTCTCEGCPPPPLCVSGAGDTTCSCPGGFLFDAGTCVDVDECSSANQVCGDERCVNTAGGYRCACLPGRGPGSCAFLSCLDAKKANPDASSGLFRLDPDGDGPARAVDVWCDMSTDDGGWALVATAQGPWRGSAPPTWVDVLSVNFFGVAGVVIDAGLPADVSPDAGFFALTRALAPLRFGEVRLVDGRGDAIQHTAATTSLTQIHDETGVAPLFTDGGLTGTMLVLGNAAHREENGVPCFYPRLDGTGCESFYQGDTGHQSTAFFVGHLAACRDGGAALGRLWGSNDCFGSNTYGGYAGFVYVRPLDANTPHVRSGYQGAGWQVWLR